MEDLNMRGPNRIVIVRHGESEGNVISPEDISFFDKPNHAFCLTEKGRQQASNAGAYLHRTYNGFDVCFCSTFKRTQETLARLWRDPLMTPIMDSRLNEIMRGIWHTLPKERLLSIFPDEEIVRKREGEYHYRPPAGQSCQDVEVLIYSFMADLRENYNDKDILIAAHGNWMLVFWRLILKKSPEEYEERYRNNKYANCALAIYEKNKDHYNLSQDNFVVH